MKYLKYIAITFLSLVILLVVGSYVAISTIDKSIIEEQVSDAIGRDLKINGEIVSKLSLNPSARVTKLTLANAEWASKKPLVDIGELEFGLKIKPLLFGDIELSELSIKDAEISLEKGKKWNFEFSEEDNSKENDESSEGGDFVVDEITLENLKVSVSESGKTSIYNIESFSLEEDGELSDLELAMKMDGEKLELDAEITPIKDLINGDNAQINELSISMSGYKISGELKADLAKKKPYVNGKINIADIDLSGSEEEVSDSSKEVYSKSSLPFDILNSFDGDVGIFVSSIKMDDGIKLSKISIPAKISAGVLNAKGITANLLDSKIRSDLKLSSSSSAFNFNMDNVELGKLLVGKDFTGGYTNLQANFNASGRSIHSLINTLTGNTKFHLRDAVYSGQEKSGALEELFKLLAGGNVSSKTEINCVIADIDWTNGIGEVYDLGIATDYALVKGDGKVKLPVKAIDLVLIPSAKNIGLTDFVVPPIAVSGEFSNLNVYPDPQGTAIEAVKTAATIASGVGIFAKIGEVVADKTGVTESVGLADKNPCEVASESGKEE